jgi:hypothetical protein
MRFLEVKFNAYDKIAYTYEYDGDDEIKAGETRVEVLTFRGLSIATVVGVHNAKPVAAEHITLKPIERVLPAPPLRPMQEPR